MPIPGTGVSLCPYPFPLSRSLLPPIPRALPRALPPPGPSLLPSVPPSPCVPIRRCHAISLGQIDHSHWRNMRDNPGYIPIHNPAACDSRIPLVLSLSYADSREVGEGLLPLLLNCSSLSTSRILSRCHCLIPWDSCSDHFIITAIIRDLIRWNSTERVFDDL